MGAGPSALARAGAADRLRARGHAVTETQLDPTSPWRAELRTAFELLRRVADAASTAHGTGQVPLLLSGNCNSTVGMLGGLIRSSQRRVGLVWLDAHGDFNTPAIDPWGFLDGQGLAMAVGGCWQALTATVPGFIPLPEQRVVLVGARSLDDQEAPALRDSQVTWLPPARARHTETVRDAVHRLATESDIVHIHVDLDVHDPSIAPANGYAAPDGLTAEHVRAVVREVADQLPVSSATLASYDPAYDPAGRMRDTALDLLALVADLATPLAAARYL
jgi:arginase